MKNRIILMSMLLSMIAAKAQKMENIFSTNVGEYTVYLLSEGQNKGNTEILIGATPEMIAEQIPEGTFPNATNVFLIQSDDKNILVDTGYGRMLLDNLEAIGLAANKIDAILITHAHGDHIGGLLKNGQVVFPNARLYISQAEHDYWTSSNNSNFIKVIDAYKERLFLFEPDNLDSRNHILFPGIIPIATYGHTPGHTSFLIESKNDQLLIWGDLTHAMAIQMPYPQVAVTYDVDPKGAIFSREEVLKYVAGNKILVAGMHIAFPAIGNIQPDAKGGYTFDPIK